MKNQGSPKTDQENQENVKVLNRKPLKTLQEGTTTNENFPGHTILCNKCKSPIGKNESEAKPTVGTDEQIQTGEPVVTLKDLTSDDEPSADYWRLLAETRGKSLDESLDENEKLQQLVESLEEENQKCNDLVNESRNLVEVLQEMIEENEGSEGEGQDNS